MFKRMLSSVECQTPDQPRDFSKTSRLDDCGLTRNNKQGGAAYEMTPEGCCLLTVLLFISLKVAIIQIYHLETGVE